MIVEPQLSRTSAGRSPRLNSIRRDLMASVPLVGLVSQASGLAPLLAPTTCFAPASGFLAFSSADSDCWRHRHRVVFVISTVRLRP